MGQGMIMRRGKFEGGGGLNYSVEAYASVGVLPASADENTIAIITSTALGAVYFQADEPAAPSAGDVWIFIRPYSLREFNLLDEGSIILSPTSYIKQYNGSTWDYCDSRIYQSGSWLTLELIIYKNGDLLTITGGWTTSADKGSYLYIAAPTSTTTYTGTNNTIDFTNVATLYIYCDTVSATSAPIAYLSTSTTQTGSVASRTLVAGWNTFDVSATAGSYHFVLGVSRNTSAGTSTLQVSRIEEDSTT